MAAEPDGQHKGSDDSEGDIGAHPELGSAAALAGLIAGGDEESEFAQAVREERGEAGAD